jgi:hypothetical protein
MKHINFVYINELSKLHNGDNIFFCKTDFLQQDFHLISQLPKDVILISGNSDYSITDDIVNLAPKNIKKWYAQNTLSNHPILESIPIGLENKLPSSREGHGVGYFDRASLKESLLEKTNLNNKEPTKLIYANFNINTNPYYRNLIKEMCQKASFIDWEEPRLSLDSFFDKVSQYKMIVCPAGNGLDTHRLWEALYCNRIPITFKVANYKLYELYNKLPIILLNNIDQLLDKNFIMQEYNRCLSQVWDKSLLDVNLWIKTIQNKD